MKQYQLTITGNGVATEFPWKDYSPENIYVLNEVVSGYLSAGMDVKVIWRVKP